MILPRCRGLRWQDLRHNLQLLRISPLRMSSSETPRINQVGIQYISNGLHKKLFPQQDPEAYRTPKNPELIEIAKHHLQQNNLLGKKTQINDPIDIKNFPSLEGSSMDEHFHKLGTAESEPYLSMAEEFLSGDVPPLIATWEFQSGWTRYVEGQKPEKVDFPLEDSLVFDVEVLYKRSNYPLLATCASSKAWYGWVSPFLVNFQKDPTYNDFKHLIPFDCLSKEKLMIGYYVSYDRARVLEEYNIRKSKAFYLDGMSLHVAVAGICSQQRISWQKHKKVKNELEEVENEDYSSEYDIAMEISKQLIDDPWLNKGTPNSLKNVAEFHCGIIMDKSDRDFFGGLDPQPIVDNFNRLMTYCAKDVQATFEVTKKLLPEYRQKVPHPVSFAAMKSMGLSFLPTSTNWENYLQTTEKVYQDNRKQVVQNLKDRVEALLEYIELGDESIRPDLNDPWLRQLNWTIKEQRLKVTGEPTAKQAYLTGYPEWYRELCKVQSTQEDGSKTREANITIRTRITPLLLKLKWEGYPIVWTVSEGWCFKVPFDENVIADLTAKYYKEAKLNEEEMEKFLPELRDDGNNYLLFKVPHPEGAFKRCTSIFSKSYLRFFENGTLTSEYPNVQEILTLNNSASYWMGNRKRIMDQFVVYPDENHLFAPTTDAVDHHADMGIIIPQVVSMGTITRRSTENTWLTASNAKKDRIGSELKAMIKAPDGYCFVGADVDSEELWIASLVGDALFKVHGATALGWMTLEGDKNEGTDLHSKTAEIMGISRGDAKVFNYGRIYGAGVKFATRLLKQFNGTLSDEQAQELARQLYTQTKGKLSKSRAWDRKLYHGGSESIMFNALESIAYEKDPRTPVLGAAITNALTIANLNKNEYLTSRVNWAIQSSGVDYLHLLVVSMDYLIKKYQVDARLAITVHDEVRYLVKEEDKYKAALLLQISNVWTRAMFSEQLGISELPQSCAYFSEVDIDTILRKETTLDCITPSHPEAIAPGESLDINQLLAKVGNGEILGEDRGGLSSDISNMVYSVREHTLAKSGKGLSVLSIIARARLECSSTPEEWKENNAVFCESMQLVSSNRARTGDFFESTQKRAAKSKLKTEVDIGESGKVKEKVVKGSKVKVSKANVSKAKVNKDKVSKEKVSTAKVMKASEKLREPNVNKTKGKTSTSSKAITTSTKAMKTNETSRTKSKKPQEATAKLKVEADPLIEDFVLLNDLPNDLSNEPNIASLSEDLPRISTSLHEEEPPGFRPFYAIPNGRVIRSGYVRREDFHPSSRSKVA